MMGSKTIHKLENSLSLDKYLVIFKSIGHLYSGELQMDLSYIYFLETLRGVNHSVTDRVGKNSFVNGFL